MRNLHLRQGKYKCYYDSTTTRTVEHMHVIVLPPMRFTEHGFRCYCPDGESCIHRQINALLDLLLFGVPQKGSTPHYH